MALDRRSVRQQILGEPLVPAKKPVIAEVAQGGIFSAIFAVLERITETPLKMLFFPAATLITGYKTYLAWKDRYRSKNKNLSGLGSVLLKTAVFLGEAVAVAAAMAGFFGTTLFNAAFIPAIFLATVAINFVSHFTQTLYYGAKCLYNWFKGETWTHQHREDAKNFWSNLRSTFVLGVVGAAIGMLLFTPAWHLATFSAMTVATVKAVSATVVGLNAVYTGYAAVQVHRQRAIELVAREDASQSEDALLGAENSYPVLKIEEDHAEQYQQNQKNFSSLGTHHDDLLAALAAAENKELFVTSYLESQRNALLMALNVYQLKGKDMKLDTDVGLNSEGTDLDFSKLDATGWDITGERNKRQKKLYATLLLTKLMENKAVQIKGERITTVSELLKHFQDRDARGESGLVDTIFKSSFNNVGGMQKAFLLVDAYMTHKAPVNNASGVLPPPAPSPSPSS